MKKQGLVVLAMALTFLSGCGNNAKNDAIFQYDTKEIVETFGSNTNSEAHDYENLNVNKVDTELRDDFAFGVDASMTQEVEKCGGVYFNKDGKEQDVFQILKKAGVNFVRFRLWNKPYTKYNKAYGGGNNTVDVDLALAKRAKDAGLNVMIDFHYSDFWADPDQQNKPKEWGTLEQSEIPNAIKEFTKNTLTTFKDAGIHVDAVQIGNEINNGMCGYEIDWNNTETSYDVMSEMLKGGIDGAKSVFPDTRTVIHLANGGNKEEFENFFVAMDKRDVDYDIIGASYYPNLSGDLSELQANLDNVSQKTGKPVIIAETSWGFTTDYNEYTANQYTVADEDVGGYLTSEQAQATEIRDIVNILSNVPDKKGLGIFYWEPGWLPVNGACWATKYGQAYQYDGEDGGHADYEDGLATWSNQGLFSYSGKALSSLYTFKYLKEGFNPHEELSIEARKTNLEYTLNLAENETLPSTAKVVTDFDAIRDADVVWDEEAIETVKTKGTYAGLKGKVDGKYDITATAHCIENFVKDPGFENQGTTDVVKDPWVIEYSTPVDDKVVKLDRKKDIRNGKADLNWYHSSKDFTFKVKQTISNLPAGNYSLTTYIMAIAYKEIPHTKLNLYISINGGEPKVLDLASGDYLQGWSAGYQTCVIDNIDVPEGATAEIGLEGAAKAKAWAHNDDWELVNTSN